jgi:hypothetical protein
MSYNETRHRLACVNAYVHGEPAHHGHIYNDASCTCPRCVERFALRIPQHMIDLIEGDFLNAFGHDGEFTATHLATLADLARYDEALQLIDGWEEQRLISGHTRGEVAAYLTEANLKHFRLPPASRRIYTAAMEAIQAADEMGGPESHDEYVNLLRAIAAECERRAQVCLSQLRD